MFVGDSIVGKTGSALSKGDDVVVCFPGAKIKAVTEGVEKSPGSWQGRIDSSTRRN